MGGWEVGANLQLDCIAIGFMTCDTLRIGRVNDLSYIFTVDIPRIFVMGLARFLMRIILQIPKQNHELFYEDNFKVIRSTAVKLHAFKY